MHLYCIAVQAGFYSDVVECSTIDRRVPGSILGWGMEIFLRICDMSMNIFITSGPGVIQGLVTPPYMRALGLAAVGSSLTRRLSEKGSTCLQKFKWFCTGSSVFRPTVTSTRRALYG